MNQGNDIMTNTGKFSYGVINKANLLDDDEIAGSHILSSGLHPRNEPTAGTKFNRS